ncbi:ABC transporter [Streptomyces leeuwenhoekii]|uniref:ABC transporter n=1 Tax=Streptomyces leeuwenhoekii TaxID=1437453 RepID=UPI0036946139
MRVIRALAGPVWRTLPWRALGAAGAVGLLIAALPRLGEGEPGPWATLLALRGAALAGGLGLAFLLDDPARQLTAPVPVRRPLRQALRAALVVPGAALWWAAVLLLAPAGARPPVAALTLEAGVVCVLALAAAAGALRLTDEARPGRAVAAVLLTAAVLAPLLLPERWALFVPPDDVRWAAAHDRWALVLAGAAALWAVCGPEPVRRRAARPRAGRSSTGAV